MHIPSSRSVPTNYCTTWISVCANLLKVNYPLALGVGFLYAGVVLFGYLLGTVGSALTTAACTFLVPGQLLITYDFIKGEKSNFNRLFYAFQDQELIFRMLPLVVFNTLYSFVGNSVLKDYPLMNFAMALVVTPIVYFSVPLMTFEKIPFLKTIPHSIQAVLKNIMPLILLSILGALLLVGLAILLLLPLILYGLPLLMLAGYPIYASIFLNMDLNALNESLKIKNV